MIRKPDPRLGSLLLTGSMVMAAALCSPLAAQDRSRIWLGLGLGSAGRADGAAGFAVMGEVVYQIRAHHLAIRAMGAADPFGTGADEFGEFGLLYGRAAKRHGDMHRSLEGWLSPACHPAAMLPRAGAPRSAYR